LLHEFLVGFFLLLFTLAFYDDFPGVSESRATLVFLEAL
jgi:hypothetical protein